MNKHRTLRQRRIYRARKIAHRKGVARNVSYFNWLLDRKNGRFANRLTYRTPNLQLYRVSYHDRQMMDSLNHRMEDYYNEGICEY